MHHLLVLMMALRLLILARLWAPVCISYPLTCTGEVRRSAVIIQSFIIATGVASCVVVPKASLAAKCELA